MGSAIQLALLLLLSLSISDAKIEFTYSTIYQVYDFAGKAEVPLPRCNAGCLIFASAFGIYEENMDPYIKSLVINDPVNGKLATIGELVNKFHPDTTQKLPLDIPATGNYSILNLNPLDIEGKFWDVTIWIIERAKAQSIDYEIYDAKTMRRAPAVTNSVITIMGGTDIELTADKTWEVNSFTARLAGFDNAFDDNEDLCESVLHSPVGTIFDGFNFDVSVPLVSLVFANKTRIDLKGKDSDCRYRSLSSPGFITSPGYIGCKRLGVYHNMFYHYTERIVLSGEYTYQVDIDCTSDLGEGSDVKVMDVTKLNINLQPARSSSGRDARQKRSSVGGGSGRMRYQVTIPNTKMIFVDYTNVTAPGSFFMKYTATRMNRLPSPQETTIPTIASTVRATTTRRAATAGMGIISPGRLATTSATAVISALTALAVVCANLLVI